MEGMRDLEAGGLQPHGLGPPASHSGPWVLGSETETTASQGALALEGKRESSQVTKRSPLGVSWTWEVGASALLQGHRDRSPSPTHLGWAVTPSSAAVSWGRPRGQPLMTNPPLNSAAWWTRWTSPAWSWTRPCGSSRRTSACRAKPRRWSGS